MIIAVILFVSGCKNGAESPIKTNYQITNEKKVYKSKFVDLENVSKENPLAGYYSFGTEYIYYVVDETRHDEAGYTSFRSIRRISVNGGDSENIYESKSGFLLSYTVASDDVCYALVALDDGYEIVTIEGSDDSEIKDSVKFEVSNDSERPAYALKTSDDECVAIFNNRISVMDKNGKTLKKIDFKAEYVNKCCLWKPGKLLIAYTEKNNSYVAIYDVKNTNIQTIISIPTVEGYIATVDDGILTTGGGDVYHRNFDTEECTAITDLVEYSIRQNRLKAIGATNDCIYLLTGNEKGGGMSLGLVCLNRNEVVDNSQEKEIIRVLTTTPSLMGMFISDDMIIDFNERSDKYRVEISETELGYEGMETALIEEESPDVLVLPTTYIIENYSKNGLLEDLWPYIDNSEIINRNDLPDNMLEAFEKDNKLYALSQRLTVQTLRLRKSQAEGMTGWTPEEFVNWLKKHPDTFSAFGLEKEKILDYCLRCDLDEYIDFSTGDADFESEKFINLLKLVDTVKLDNEGATFVVGMHAHSQMSEYSQENALLIDSAIDMFSGVFLPEINFGEEIVHLGYPNSERNNTGMFISNGNFSIYSGSSNKEGAFEFIEYCIKHLPYDYYADYDGSIKMNEDCQIPSLKSEREKRLSERLGEYSVTIAEGDGIDDTEIVFQVEKYHADELEAILTNAVSDNMEKYNIRTIIREESEPFFKGLVSAEDTAKVIQSRVQILLYENR